jgi:hypothetical protein
MSPLVTGLISACCIFGGALLGMRLQRLLPSHHLSKEMQDLVKLSAGTIATLTALVLGLLVSSAKSSFDAINTGIVQGSANVIFLDHTLARYGPETGPVREELKRTVAAGIEKIWPEEKSGSTGVAALERTDGMEAVQEKLSEVIPKTDAQHAVLTQAQQLTTNMGQSRWLLIEETHTQLPFTLLVILVFWLVLLFVSFGLFAPENMTAHVVLLVGACAISAAIFLVLELNQPLEGLIKVSSTPLRNALQHLGQ